MPIHTGLLQISDLGPARKQFLIYSKGRISRLLFCVCLFGVLELELRALSCLGRCSTSYPQPYFWIGSHIYEQAGLNFNPPTYASCIARMRGMHHPIQLLLLEKVSHKLFA